MSINHSQLTGADLHEPKGAATEPEGKAYITDGVGSGSWQYPHEVLEEELTSKLGWGYYQDAGLADQVFTSTPTKIKIDNGGTLTNTSFLPREMVLSGSSLWDPLLNKITPVRLGDSYSLRLDIPITASTGAPTYIELSLDIGDQETQTIKILEYVTILSKSGVYTITRAFPITVLTAPSFSAGYQIFVRTDTGTVTVNAPSLTIIKTTDGAVYV